MNKGMRIWKAKQEKKKKKFVEMQKVKENQVDSCQFVEAEFTEIKKVNGKWKPQGKKQIKGLQMRSRIYLSDGGYKLVNNKKNMRIKKRYNGIPEWATEELIGRYEAFHKSE